MLYPTYLSAYRNLLQADIAPLSLTKTILGDKPTSLIPRSPAISPPPSPPSTTTNTTKPTRLEEREVKGAQGAQRYQGGKRGAKSPITISDQHSRAVLKGVNETTANTIHSSSSSTTTAAASKVIGQTSSQMASQSTVVGVGAGQSRPVNALVGGFGRYVWMLLMERGVQLMMFPLVCNYE